MEEDEAIMFGGMTLARLTGIPALFHRVDVDRCVRISACFFQRPSPGVLLPATRDHEAESVDEFNAKTRAAFNDELTGSGAIIVAPQNRRDYERRLAKELWHMERLRGSRSRAGESESSRDRIDILPMKSPPCRDRDDRWEREFERSRERWSERSRDRWSDRWSERGSARGNDKESDHDRRHLGARRADRRPRQDDLQWYSTPCRSRG